MSVPATFTIRPDEKSIVHAEARSDEAVRSTGVIEVSEVGPHVVVGENHLRLVNIPEFQTQFDNYIYSLARGDFILVEHYSAPEWNIWTRRSTVTRFMQQAEQYPDVSNGINLQVLDDVPHWTVLESAITAAGVSRSDLIRKRST